MMVVFIKAYWKLLTTIWKSVSWILFTEAYVSFVQKLSRLFLQLKIFWQKKTQKNKNKKEKWIQIYGLLMYDICNAFESSKLSRKLQCNNYN